MAAFDFASLAAGVRLADGAWSTQLHARGWPRSRPAELASLKHPQLVLELARDYVAAGAQIISTNTFAANRLMLEARRVSLREPGHSGRQPEATSAAQSREPEAQPLPTGQLPSQPLPAGRLPPAPVENPSSTTSRSRKQADAQGRSSSRRSSVIKSGESYKINLDGASENKPGKSGKIEPDEAWQSSDKASSGIAENTAEIDLAELNTAAVRLAKQAAEGQRVLIAGVIGPSGKILAVRESTDEALRSCFQEQAAALSSAGVDLIVLETFTELAEITLAIQAVRAATRLPIVACMSFDCGPQRTRTTMGAEASGCAAALEEAGADGVGFNCGAGVALALPIAVALRAATRRPLWAKPSAGLPELEDGRPTYPLTVQEFVSHARQLVDAGVNVIGGCCGTGPEYIAELAAALKRAKRPGRPIRA